ncbi:hypothetical protein ACIFOE_20510 [Paenibacillus sp. NRS-1783]|uniref:hypothetical protein n=1 Tax=Paenibacillus sp. NRS-1783 TaxID=3233907 RepID=UPI003D2C1CEB
MLRGWYGLYLGDKVIFNSVGTKVEGVVVRLSLSNKNKCWILDDNGKSHEAACEWCKRIPPEDSLFIFRPVSGVMYTVLYYEEGNCVKVNTYTGDEVTEKIMRVIKYLGQDISKIDIYVRDTSSNENSLYQSLDQSDFIQFTDSQ